MERTLLAIGIGVVLVNTAMAGASAVGTLVAVGTLGEAWSGAPNAAAILGTAIGALGIGALMARRGRQSGLLVAYAVASLGAGLAAVGVLSGALVWLMAGMLLLGVGNAAANLSRYVIAELFPPERRGSVVGGVVWAGTFGAIVGPNLLGPAAGLATRAHVPAYSAAYIVALIAMAGAGLVLLLMPGRAAPAPAHLSRRATHSLLDRRVVVPLAAMVAANFTMVAVMTMTPVQAQLHGQSLQVVGLVISAHMLGMFALSPLSGWLADHRGGERVICLGVGTLAFASVVAAAVDPSDPSGLAFGVFLLGLGWNLCWVGGSSLLAREGAAQVEGDVDALVWTTSTAASLVAGALLAVGGYALVAGVGGAVAVLALLPFGATRLMARRQALAVKEVEA